MATHLTELCCSAQLELVDPALVSEEVQEGTQVLLVGDPETVEASVDDEEIKGCPKILVRMAPVNSIDDDFDFSLPQDDVALLAALQQWCQPRETLAEHRERNNLDVLMVSSWHGGGGATSCAMAAANVLKALLLDASGNYGLPIGEIREFRSKRSAENEDLKVTWQLLDPDDLPPQAALISSLPRLGAVPILTNSLSAEAPAFPLTRADSQLVERVAASSPRPVVVDCATFVGEALVVAQFLERCGKKVRFALIGDGRDQTSFGLARSLQVFACGGKKPLVLVRGSPRELFRMAVDRHRIDWVRAPRPRNYRAWRTLLGTAQNRTKTRMRRGISITHGEDL